MAIRKASKAPFPYGAPATDKVAYFFVTADSIPEQLRTATQLEAALEIGATIYAAWPGKSRTDLFVIDEPDLLKESLR
jgi:hypothetical protein